MAEITDRELNEIEERLRAAALRHDARFPRDYAHAGVKRLVATVREQRARIEDLEKDEARLDWMRNCCWKLIGTKEDPINSVWKICGDGGIRQGLRAAIDKAMKAAP